MTGDPFKLWLANHAHEPSGIGRENAEALHRTVRETQATHCLEVGLAQGVSTVAILSALPADGSLVSIDPGQAEWYDNIGVQNVADAGYSYQHTLMEVPDYVALPQLLDGVKFDLIYIDGWHSFDYVMLDLFYANLLLRVGGVIGFNDCGWPAVHKVIRFIGTHLHYTEYDAGLRRDFGASNPAKRLFRRLTGRVRNDRYFRKDDDHLVPWTYYRPF